MNTQAIRITVLLLTAATSLFGAKLAVTVFDEKTGEPLEGLTAQSFVVTDGKLRLTVESAEPSVEMLDMMLIADASFIADAIQPLVHPMIQGLPEGAQMAFVSFDQSATLLQDFTNSKNLLVQANQKIKRGNNPRVLDALFAALDGGFSGSPGRRTAVVLAAGVEGNSRVGTAEVIALARRYNVAIYIAYAEGVDAGLFKKLAEETGGAWFHLKKLNLTPLASAALIHSTIGKGAYLLDVSGVDRFGDRLSVEIAGLPKSDKKVVVTARPIE